LFIIFMEDYMTDRKEWPPKKEQDLVDSCNTLDAGLNNSAVVTAFGWNQQDVTATSTAIGGFLTAREAFEKDDSSANRLAKNEAKKAVRKAMQVFAKYNIRNNRLMTPEQKLYYGIRTPDPKPTPTPRPATVPDADADTSISRQVTVHFWDRGSTSRAKPHGVHGAEIRWAILDHEPVSVKELINSDFDTASPFTLFFDESDRGKRLYYSLRWESNNNKKGSFGDIYSVVIP
jgi:hypothetical protein